MNLDFPHTAPEGHHYEYQSFKLNVVSIWIHNHQKFDYNNGKLVKSIWGFYNTKTKCYHSPINSLKCGKKIDIKNTTPYSAMQIKRTPLELAFMQ